MSDYCRHIKSEQESYAFCKTCDKWHCEKCYFSIHRAFKHEAFLQERA